MVIRGGSRNIAMGELKQYPRRDHPSFAAAGANAFELEKYLQVQNKINCSGQDIRYKARKARRIC